MKIAAVVAAAGIGRRIKQKYPKPLIDLNGKPVIIHTLKNLASSDLIDEIIVVANKARLDIFKKKIRSFGIKKIKGIIAGGSTRTKSVIKGIKAVSKDSDLVLIHDGVRPFISRDLIKQLISAAKASGAAIAGVPVKPTIKECQAKRLEVRKTLNRNVLWEAQTPQVFKKALILNAYNKLRNFNFTDDSALVERLNRKVRIVKGDYLNIKITTPVDLALAKIIAKNFRS